MRRVVAALAGAVSVAGAVGVAIGAPAAAPKDGGPLTDRSFTIRADAFPVEPAPGVNQTNIGVRPAATHVALSNAPASAYGRAAAGDAGTVELYTGPPPPGSVAECDATAPNLPRASTAAPAGMALEAACDERPSARTTALASPLGGTSRSAVSGDGGGETLVADATAEVHDAVVGAIRLATATYTASVRADGQPGGAVATGRVSVTDATVADVPVVIGPDGVSVDESKVPIDLVPAAADAVRTALSQGDYSDVRVVQPQATAAPDGTRAEVRGGGVFFYGTSADPKNNYFLRFTLVGGSTLVALGGAVGDVAGGLAGAAPDLAGVGGAGDLARPDAFGGSPAPPSGAAGDPPTSARAENDATALAVDIASDRRALPSPWRGWWWLVAAAALAAIGAVAWRRRVARWWDTTADRYVRG